MNFLRFLLFPLSWLYGIGVRLRHKLFDIGLLKSESFDIPVISVGNLNMGGTGKTPVVEYLIRLLVKDYNLATLSRGYGRKTTGFLKSDQFTEYKDIGDEPLQYFKKFGKKIIVAVDEQRTRGIHYLVSDNDSLDVILLDDAFQHRYVKPGMSILLTDFHNLFVNDFLFPFGTLRDTRNAAKNADIILVTKGPRVLSPIEREHIAGLLKPKETQTLYFSFLEYGNLTAVPGTHQTELPDSISTLLLFTGIANSYPLQDHLRNSCNELIVIDYPDHHSFKRKDLQRIRDVYDDIYTSKKIIVTTEKDAMRLINSPYLSELIDVPVYYMPVTVKLQEKDGLEFNEQIKSYVKESKRNR